MAKRVIVVGAGGHAQVVADILLRMKETGKEIVPAGYVDDDPALKNKVLLGLPVLGTLADLNSLPHDAVIVAVGNCRTRRHLYTKLRANGENFAVARHPSAVIASHVRIGRGTVICASVVVNSGSVIGSNVILNTACTVDHHNRIDDHVHVAPGVHLGGGVSIGEGTLIGIGAIVLPQRQIGESCIVGAGSLVNKDLADGVTAIGVPAHRMRQTSDTTGGHA